ncbi:MAG TPA: hypothetical protein VJT49_01975 [Amycolatopsis sp.]|uniref:hypothetical protein n=1 Tax=Amycolatopsis sp. TaxID=37632 RepID=UPI002B4A47FE|nr:hypothetical protein [Amycolatopsis sp.]HKS43880.1 hypothetical protein [Amycolatopsis sp.]
MRTLTRLLAGFDQDRSARFRGLVLGQLVRASRGVREPGLLHLFLLPPGPGETRFSIYETSQPLNLEVPVPEAIRQALAVLHSSCDDPRLIAGGDEWWRTVDAGRQALYLGSGARLASPDPDLACPTIVRLVDRTAFYLALDARQQPTVLQASEPMIMGEQAVPAQRIHATMDPPFTLIDTIVASLR